MTEETHNNNPNNGDDDNDNEVVVESAGDGTTAADQVLHGAPLVLSTLALVLCALIVSLDQTIIAPLLSEVGNKFGEFGKISWVSAGFLLPPAVLAMNWGDISLLFGRKYTMIAAIVLFEIGSLICALANSMNMLIGGRVLAGVGGGGVQVMMYIIMTEIVTIRKRGLFQGIMGAAYGIGAIIGPLIGGAFTTNVTWRWCFYINLPIGGCALLSIWWFFNPPYPTGSVKEKLLKIDYIGTILLSAGLVLVLLALTFGSTSKPWSDSLVIAFFVVGGVLMMVFFYYNFFLSKHPLIPSRVAKVPQVLAPCFCFFFMYSSFISSMLYLATYFQVVHNANAIKSGVDLLPIIIALIVSSIASGVLVTKTRLTKHYAIFGAVTGAIGFGVMTLLDENSGSAKRIGYLILPGIGVGFLLQGVTISLQIAAPKDNGGVIIAMAMINFFRNLGGTVGSSIGQTIQSVVFTSNVEKQITLPANIKPGDLLGKPELIRSLSSSSVDKVIESFVTGFRAVVYYQMANMIAAFFCILIFTNKKIPKENDVKKGDDEKVEA